jgi:hypothetical protein
MEKKATPVGLFVFHSGHGGFFFRLRVFSSSSMNPMTISVILSVTAILQWQLIHTQTLWDNSMWTWLSGTNAITASGVYGTKGIPSINNFPGNRHDHSMAFDPIRNYIYIFGGIGYPDTAPPSKTNFNGLPYS